MTGLPGSAAVLATVGVVLTLLAAAVLGRRPQDRRLARLLVLLCVTYAVRGLGASDVPWVFGLGRALGQLAEFVLVWVMLSFPTGRLRSRRDRVIVAMSAFSATVLWLPTVLFSAAVPLPGPLVPCAPDCPRNVLLVEDLPQVADGFLTAFRWLSATILLSVALSLLDRLVRSGPGARRTLAPLLVVSILRTLAVAVFVVTNGAVLSGAALTLLFWAVPLAMLLGLLLARLHAAGVLLRLVSGLQHRPDADALRRVMATALRDPGLDIVYWLPDRSRWADSAGVLHSTVPVSRPGQAVTPVDGSDGEPLARVVHDEVLLDQPALLAAVTQSVRMALETNRDAAELALSGARIADARDSARRAIERDLHDGAQQRLIALRMKVSVLSRLLPQDARRAARLAEELGPDVDAALREIRDVAHGAGPRLLHGEGLSAALADAVGRFPEAVSLRIEGVGRYPGAVESAVYFTCLEAVQNAVKHAGPTSTVTVELTDDGRRLSFSVRDDGPGLSPADSAGSGGPPGAGLANMRARMSACGGEVSVVGRPGEGTEVRGHLPLRHEDA
ncbi:ATP-binding protein [Streptomyces sp. NBC_00094]|uniref:sensor histidine kinase n=1 Tax=Streptomyces sp. NBC_00094 TaxID=2903620 RepID=UPI0022574635|nr:ATP-binding protein [Streptomyces sp. NBC_00094]MCX5394359.1 ATP-binding protein [Streptomyces sp. NBC_00094]